MREGLHVVFRHAAELMYLDPWPCTDVRDGVFAFALACKVFTGLPGVLARKLDLEYAKHT